MANPCSTGRARPINASVVYTAMLFYIATGATGTAQVRFCVGATLLQGPAMWPAVLLFSSATGLALGRARLKVLALIPAAIVLSVTAAIAGVVSGLQWGTIALTVIAAATMLQCSYLIEGLHSEAPSPRATPRTRLRSDVIHAAQFAIGDQLRTQFQTPHHLPRQLRTRIKKLAVRYG